MELQRNPQKVYLNHYNRLIIHAFQNETPENMLDDETLSKILENLEGDTFCIAVLEGDVLRLIGNKCNSVNARLWNIVDGFVFQRQSPYTKIHQIWWIWWIWWIPTLVDSMAASSQPHKGNKEVSLSGSLKKRGRGTDV